MAKFMTKGSCKTAAKAKVKPKTPRMSPDEKRIVREMIATVPDSDREMIATVPDSHGHRKG